VDSRAMLSYYLGNALASLSFLQSGAEGSANLHLALEAYRKAREAYPSKNTPWNWEHLKTTLGPQARSQWVDIQDGISSTLDRISNEGSTYDRTITVPEELTALREALKAFPPDGAPLDWGKISASFGRTEGGYEYNFRLYWAAHHLEIGILLLEIQPKGTQSVREAMKAFNVAFAALDWTNPKNTLGLSLQEEIRMKNDWRNYQVEFAQTLLRFRPDGVQEAVKAYREVLASFPKDPPSSWVDLSSDVDATYTMESTKATWRNTTIALAKTLMDEKPEGLQSIRDAVNMYSDVFDAFPKGSPLSWTTTSVDIILSPPPFKAWIQEDMMESWTDTKIALGDALQKLSDHQPGAKGIPSLKKAAQAYKDAMMIYSSYKTPEADLRPRTALLRLQLRHLEGWTDTKIALGVVLQALGERQPGKEGAANLKTSAEEFRAVLRRLSLQKGDDLSDRVTTAQEHLDQTLRLLQQRMNHTTHGKG
jgi:tetratricopeptide (TPR) repeat protein